MYQQTECKTVNQKCSYKLSIHWKSNISTHTGNWFNICNETWT